MLARSFQIRLREALVADKRTIKQIALDAGYSKDYLSAVKNSRKINPTLQFVETMAVTLDRSPGWLLGLEVS